MLEAMHIFLQMCMHDGPLAAPLRALTGEELGVSTGQLRNSSPIRNGGGSSPIGGDLP